MENKYELVEVEGGGYKFRPVLFDFETAVPANEVPRFGMQVVTLLDKCADVEVWEVLA